MHIAFLNPQGNFDASDYGWTLHPDFGGQLVYVKEVTCALGELGHRVDILTRQIVDRDWPDFAAPKDGYPGHPNVRILRMPCGPPEFLRKEDLWPTLNEWVNNILDLYREEGSLPYAATGHYADGGLAGALLQERTGIPFTFTGHSLGAQKMDKLIQNPEEFSETVEHFRFDRRIAAERVSMARAARIITSTRQERLGQYGHHLYEGAVDPSHAPKFDIVPPGINLTVFGADARNDVEDAVAQKIRAMLARDIPSERQDLPAVICSSRLDPKKNHLALVKAWAVSEPLRSSANLLMVARGCRGPLRDWEQFFDGEEYEVMKDVVDVVRRHDLWSCVSLFDLNSQSELAAAYRFLAKERRGVFALTALYEPFGLAPLEAMAAGLPAVVTKNGGPSESMCDGDEKIGILVDPEDPQDIARGLTEVTLSPERWEQLRTAGMQGVRKRFTWERTAEGYLRALSDILAGGGVMRMDFRIPAWFTDAGGDGVHSTWLRELYFRNQDRP